MSVLDYLFNTNSGTVEAPPQSGGPQDLISILMGRGSPTQSPLQSDEGARQEAIKYLQDLTARPADPLETGTPGSNPAPNVGGFNDSRGLGTIGGLAGSLAGGPIGGAVGRGLGTAVGSFADAARANDIAASLGLGPVADPAAAAGLGLGRSAAMSAATFGANAVAPGLGSLAGRAVGSFGGTPAYGTDIATAIGQHVAAMNMPTALDYEDMALGLNMQANAMAAAGRPDMAYGMAAGFGSKAGLGIGNDEASSDYGAENDGSQGGTNGGDKGETSSDFANGGVVELPGGGKVASGPGGGLDDLIPTSIDGRRAAALSDGEFVIPADVVSMMGDGSSNAGSRRLYDLVRNIRQEKTGTSRQAGPIRVGDILKRIMQ